MKNNKASYKTSMPRAHLDQYYTNPTYIAHCVSVIKKKIPRSNCLTWIDFSAGTNDFLRKLKPAKKYAFDLEPRSAGVKKMDWFKVTRKTIKGGGDFAVGFNPPYGKMGHLARNFVKHAASEFKPKYMALLSPKISWGRLKDYHPIHVELCPPKSFYTIDGSGKRVPFGYSVPFVILKHDPLRRKEPKYVAKYVAKISQTNGKDSELQAYDLVVSMKGEKNVYKHVFLKERPGKWGWFINGKISKTLKSPADSPLSMKHCCQSRILFNSNVSRAQKLAVAKRLHSKVPDSVHLSTPASVPINVTLQIVDKMIARKT